MSRNFWQILETATLAVMLYSEKYEFSVERKLSRSYTVLNLHATVEKCYSFPCMLQGQAGEGGGLGPGRRAAGRPQGRGKSQGGQLARLLHCTTLGYVDYTLAERCSLIMLIFERSATATTRQHMPQRPRFAAVLARLPAGAHWFASASTCFARPAPTCQMLSSRHGAPAQRTTRHLAQRCWAAGWSYYAVIACAWHAQRALAARAAHRGAVPHCPVQGHGCSCRHGHLSCVSAFWCACPRPQQPPWARASCLGTSRAGWRTPGPYGQAVLHPPWCSPSPRPSRASAAARELGLADAPPLQVVLSSILCRLPLAVLQRLELGPTWRWHPS